MNCRFSVSIGRFVAVAVFLLVAVAAVVLGEAPPGGAELLPLDLAGSMLWPVFVGATYNKFQTFVRDLARKVMDIRAAGGTFNCYLSNTPPSASLDAVKADLAEIATGNGYTGPQDMQQDESYSAGTMSMTATDITITASGGSIGPFQYVVAYDDTPVSPADPLMCWWDYGSALTLNDGESFTIDFGATVWSLT